MSKDLTQRSGITKRSLRLRRYAWIVWRNTESSVWALCGGLTAHDLWSAFRQDVTLTELMASAIHARGWAVLDVRASKSDTFLKDRDARDELRRAAHG